MSLFLAGWTRILLGMPKTTPKSRQRQTAGRPAKAGATYRGITVLKPSSPSRFSDEQIDEAVKAAIAKHPRLFAAKA